MLDIYAYVVFFFVTLKSTFTFDAANLTNLIGCDQ